MFDPHGALLSRKRLISKKDCDDCLPRRLPETELLNALEMTRGAGETAVRLRWCNSKVIARAARKHRTRGVVKR
jgi:hypothetical protein